MRALHFWRSMKIEFQTRAELMKWLKNTTSSILLSISLVGGAQELYVQASSARALTNITQSSEEYFEEGAYLVEYEQVTEDESNEFIYTNIATAFTVKSQLARHPEQTFGGLDSLREALSDFEYTAKIRPSEAGYIGQLLIVIPETPDELETLKQTLQKLSIAYIFPDGTGTINQNNLKMGQGLWA